MEEKEGSITRREKQRIAVLSGHTPSLFWFRIDMMRAFQERGCEVFALGNEEEERWREKFLPLGIVYRQIHVERNGMNPLQDLKAYRSIRGLLSEIRPAKLFTYQAKTVIYGAMAANSLGITEVYPLIAGMGSVFLSTGLRASIVRGVMVQLYRRAMRQCPAVFFQNRDDEEAYRRFGMIRKQRVVYLKGSGVNTEHFSVKPLPRQTVFLFIGRLLYDKGVKEYLEACRRIRRQHPDYRCLLVGPRDTNPTSMTEEELQPFIEDGTVEYFGEQEDVRPILEQCNIFVLPSYREGTPKTVLEAMAMGRAVITTDAPGCRETVVDGENGLLVRVRDAEDLTEKMCLLAARQEEIARMGANGRRMAEEIFDVRRVNAVICETMGILQV